jgi:OTU domain-containing protein 6
MGRKKSSSAAADATKDVPAHLLTTEIDVTALTFEEIQARHREQLEEIESLVTKLYGATPAKKDKEKAMRAVGVVTDRHYQEMMAWEDANEASEVNETSDGDGDEDANAAAAALRDKATLTSDDVDDEAAKEDDARGKQQKPSKAMARKAKRAAEEAAREARIEAEKAALGPSAQAMESEVLRSRLAPLGLRVKEIRADGHCLYRSIDDQLVKVTGSGHEGGYEGLRATCAATMRDDEDSFRPFIGNCAEKTPEADERWREYVREVESTAMWGGQLEIMALSKALRRRIQVFSATMPVVVMGEDFDEDGALRVAYHQHAFGLGEHYNSVEDDKE